MRGEKGKESDARMVSAHARFHVICKPGFLGPPPAPAYTDVVEGHENENVLDHWNHHLAHCDYCSRWYVQSGFLIDEENMANLILSRCDQALKS